MKTTTTGTLGSLASFGAIAVSLMQNVEGWLRVLVLLVGFLSGALSSIRLVQKIRKERLDK